MSGPTPRDPVLTPRAGDRWRRPDGAIREVAAATKSGSKLGVVVHDGRTVTGRLPPDAWRELASAWTFLGVR